jgi:hypothetical protein
MRKHLEQFEKCPTDIKKICELRLAEFAKVRSDQSPEEFITCFQSTAGCGNIIDLTMSMIDEELDEVKIIIS